MGEAEGRAEERRKARMEGLLSLRDSHPYCQEAPRYYLSPEEKKEW